MTKRKQTIGFILIMIFLVGFISAVDTNPVSFGRYPAPSPDGSSLVFSYQGDLWKVSIDGGRALRLTVHEAYESLPVWSPDGAEIAFSSNRYGNNDIFVISAEGGVAEQLTYFSANDRMMDWMPDGRTIAFASRRDFFYHRQPVLYTVGREGGTPVKLGAFYASEGKLSPDGRWLVFSRGRFDWSRKRYRGSSNLDLWRYDLRTGQFHRLTTHPGNDMYPMWSADSRTIYYVTDKDGIFNIWSMDHQGNHDKQLTHHNKDGVRFPSIARNGLVIAYEWNAEIWTLAPASGKSHKIDIYAPTDDKTNIVEWKTFSDQAAEMTLSPDGKQIAFVVRGEIFVMKNTDKPGSAAKLTNVSARDRDIVWSPDGEFLVFASDLYGNRDLFMLKSTDPEEKRLSRSLRNEAVQLTSSEKEEYYPQFSPDGKKLAFIEGIGNLMIMDIKSRQVRCILKGWDVPEFRWSPDSKWIAYSRHDREFNTDIWIIPAQGGEPVNISRHPDDDKNPNWSADGRILAFTSRRKGDSDDIWMVYLRKEDEDKTREDLEEESEGKNGSNSHGEPPEKKPVEVQIDFGNIHKRLRRVTSMDGSENLVSISPDNKTLAFTANIRGEDDLWSIRWDGTHLKQITSGDQNPASVCWSPKGEKLYYLSKGRIRSISKDGKDGKSIPFQAAMKIDHRGERLQKFDEGWRIIYNEFYDPQFHGIDWKAMREKYRPLAAAQATIRGFNDVVSLMLGELNASHLGISGPRKGPDISTGMLGLRFDEAYRGKGLKINSVLPQGPCDKENAHVFPGEILTGINGQEIHPRINIHALLNQTGGERVLITIMSNDNKNRNVVVRPINQQKFDDLEYNRWVEAKRQKVKEWSNDKLGYVHIRGMNMPGVEQFEMELYSVAHCKEGLIIDVRNNGGGWTTDYLLAILSPRPHAYTIPRGGEKGYPLSERLPFYAWSKPIVTMCNEWSFSNAEIFPHAIKTLNRGKVVGAPTGGMVISTGSSKLIDGARFRVPYRGWYTLSTGKNQENNGCIPDVVIWDHPADEATETDRQLKQAVEVLLKDIASE